MGLEKGENKGARSYKGEVIGDSMAITINFKWLIQIIVGTALIVYAFWTFEGRIQTLERNMVQVAEEQHKKDLELQLQEQTDWIEKEFNINPFSWGKKKKKKK
jgi:hypothetical protein